MVFLLFYIQRKTVVNAIEINWNNTSSFQFTIHMSAYVWDWGHRVTCTAKSILYVFPFLTAKTHPLYISMRYQLPVCRGHQSFPGTSARILSRRHLRHIDYLNVLLHDWNGSTFWNCWNFCHPRHCEKFPKIECFGANKFSLGKQAFTFFLFGSFSEIYYIFHSNAKGFNHILSKYKIVESGRIGPWTRWWTSRHRNHTITLITKTHS